MSLTLSVAPRSSRNRVTTLFRPVLAIPLIVIEQDRLGDFASDLRCGHLELSKQVQQLVCEVGVMQLQRRHVDIQQQGAARRVPHLSPQYCEPEQLSTQRMDLARSLCRCDELSG